MNRTFLFATLLLTPALLGAGAVSVRGQQSVPPQAARPSVTLAAAAQPPAKAETPAPTRLTADQAYKANCTRCHSELPKLSPRGMKTVLMHMRVRANMPRDEARGILAYLTR